MQNPSTVHENRMIRFIQRPLCDNGLWVQSITVSLNLACGYFLVDLK